jgi:predicted phage replisome organizer
MKTETVSTKRFYWLKFQTNFFTSDDIAVILSQENGEKYVIFWLKLLLKAIEQDRPGLLRFKENIPYDEKLLSTVTNTDVDIIRSALKIFRDLGMLQILENGDLWIKDVEKLVGSESKWAEYKRVERRENRLLDNVQEKSNRVRVRDKNKDSSPSAQYPTPRKSTAEYTPDYKTFYAIYPRKIAMRAAFKKWLATLKRGVSPAELIKAAGNYAAKIAGTEERWIKHPATFLGPDEHWRDYLCTTSTTPKSDNELGREIMGL